MAGYFQIREFQREPDYEMIEDWHQGHGSPPPPEAMLPKLGLVVVEENEGAARRDVAALWLYMDNSVGVCFVEHIVTVPGLSARQARGALLCGLGYLKQAAAAMDYGLMFVHTLPAIARTLERHGFHRDREGMVAMCALTKEEK